MRRALRRRRRILGNPEIVSMRLPIALLRGRDLTGMAVFRRRAGRRPRLGAIGYQQGSGKDGECSGDGGEMFVHGGLHLA